jgi:hypothetical protein
VDNPRGRNKFARKKTTVVDVSHRDTLNKNCTFNVALSVLVQVFCKLRRIELQLGRIRGKYCSRIETDRVRLVFASRLYLPLISPTFRHRGFAFEYNKIPRSNDIARFPNARCEQSQWPTLTEITNLKQSSLFVEIFFPPLIYNVFRAEKTFFI